MQKTLVLEGTVQRRINPIVGTFGFTDLGIFFVTLLGLLAVVRPWPVLLANLLFAVVGLLAAVIVDDNQSVGNERYAASVVPVASVVMVLASAVATSMLILNVIALIR